MKKSNALVLVIFIALSAFLLWLWYRLGFSQVDYPIDLIMSIVWWALVGTLAFVIYRVEQKRRERIRTIYIAPGILFNAETGVVPCSDMVSAANLMEGILCGLEYDFDKADMPEDGMYDYRYVVRTDRFRCDNGGQRPALDAAADIAALADPTEWSGTVVRVDPREGNPETPFANKAELVAALI